MTARLSLEQIALALLTGKTYATKKEIEGAFLTAREFIDVSDVFGGRPVRTHGRHHRDGYEEVGDDR